MPLALKPNFFRLLRYIVLRAAPTLLLWFPATYFHMSSSPFVFPKVMISDLCLVEGKGIPTSKEEQLKLI